MLISLKFTNTDRFQDFVFQVINGYLLKRQFTVTCH